MSTTAQQRDATVQITPQQAHLEVKRLIATKRLAVPNQHDIIYPAGAPPSRAEIELGKALFFEPQLSGQQHLSCATCHNPTQGFGDGRAKSMADRGNTTTRHAPHLYNLAWSRVLFWDGRQDNLDTMALDAIKSPDEMNLPLATMVERLQAIPSYAMTFKQLYADGLTAANVGKAIGAFERSLITQNSAFDRYLRGDNTALSDKALRGLLLFAGKANCLACHDGANFTDESFHNIGLQTDDLGRGQFEQGVHFRYAFKTPGLRNAALTGPYMHDGSLNTLRDVVQFYNQGGQRQEGIDPQIRPLYLTAEEVDQLLAFMESLTDPLIVLPSTMPTAARESPPERSATPQESTPERSATLSGEFHFLAIPPEVGLVYIAEDQSLTQAVTIDQQGKEFLHWTQPGEKSLRKIVAASPGETMTFKNSASIGHNIYANDARLHVQFDLGLVPPGSDVVKTYPITWQAGTVLKIGCKIHPGMRLYIASLASKHYREIEFNGAPVVSFSFEALPAHLTKVAVWLPDHDPMEVVMNPGEEKEVALKKAGKLQGIVTLKRQ
jgi:cytochrome c peroxidase